MRGSIPKGVVACAVAVAASVVVAGVAGATAAAPAESGRTVVTAQIGETDSSTVNGTVQEYKVTLNNVTVEEWWLRNTTVRNATLREVTVGALETKTGTQRNVTLTNVSASEVVIQAGLLRNVTADTLVVRNRSVLNLPGADIINPELSNQRLKAEVLKNQTVHGLVIGSARIDTLRVENATLDGEVAERTPSKEWAANASNGDRPDVVVEGTSVEMAKLGTGVAYDWSVENSTAES